jgi:hypothetical protein
MKSRFAILICLGCLALKPAFSESVPRELQVGNAFHAFDHLGGIGDQADAAASAGFNIIYVSGLGSLGYEGLPPESDYKSAVENSKSYIRHAKRSGIKLAIGYVCATSIVKLNTFDKNWPQALRKSLRTPPGSWRQQDRNGNPLKSWYGGDYEPACMNNPDWRTYEHFMIKQQIDAGCDGIFFDNPTVHPQGCYCEFCMGKFVDFLRRNSITNAAPANGTNLLAEARQAAASLQEAFLRFRSEIAADFLADMRSYARTLRRDALMTANNSLNSPEVLLAQVRKYGYNIHAMSEAEDFVVVEDERSMPRMLANGQAVEYGPSYQELRSISHGKPVVAVTIADDDYHTSPNLVRLALAEAAANQCSYLGWPTWPENQRARMIGGIRPEIDFLTKHADLLQGVQAKADVVVYLPFNRWVDTAKDPVLNACRSLSRSNVQYTVVCEDQLPKLNRSADEFLSRKSARIIIVSADDDLSQKERQVFRDFTGGYDRVIAAKSADWLQTLYRQVQTPILRLDGQPYLRGKVFEKSGRTIVHLLNLNVRKKSSFDDEVFPATNIHIDLKLGKGRIRSAHIISADSHATVGKVPFEIVQREGNQILRLSIPRIDISSILEVEQ